MSGQQYLDTEQVAQIAAKIEALNNQLEDQLKQSQTSIRSLGNTWEGDASQATINAFNVFAGKYFQSYKEIIGNYVKFLRLKVEQGGVSVEEENIKLSEAFK